MIFEHAIAYSWISHPLTTGDSRSRASINIAHNSQDFKLYGLFVSKVINHAENGALLTDRMECTDITNLLRKIAMTNIAIEYLTDSDGNPKAVVIPIDWWQKRLPQGTDSLEDLAENLEDYCLTKATELTGGSVELIRVLHRRKFYRYFP